MFHFRLRTLLLSMVVAGLFFSRVAGCRQDAKVWEDLERHTQQCSMKSGLDPCVGHGGSDFPFGDAIGAWLVGEDRWSQWRNWPMRANCGPGSESDLAYVKRLPNLQLVHLSRYTISSAVMKELQEMPHLKVLELSECQLDVPPEQLLNALPQLVGVSLWGMSSDIEQVKAAAQQHPQLTVKVPWSPTPPN